MQSDMFPATLTPAAGCLHGDPPADAGLSDAAATMLRRRLREIAVARYRAGVLPPRCYFWFTARDEVRSVCAP